MSVSSTGTTERPTEQRDRVTRLAGAAAEAAQVRTLTTHPDVIALRVERVRGQVDALLWIGIVLGLSFTMVNVQVFAAEGAQPWSLPWLVAWLLDPMVGVVLVAVLRAEQVTARYQIRTPVWARRTKWFTFAATYLMNTWTSWATGDAAGVVLHSVPPMLVFAAAETGPVLRDRLTEAVHAAARDHAQAAAGDLGLTAADRRSDWPTAPPGWAPPADTIWVEDEWQQVLDGDPVGGAPTAPDREPTAADRAPADEYDRGLDSGAHNDVLVDDLERWAADRGRPPSRDDVIRAYGVGATRARTLRRICGWPRGADEEADRSDMTVGAVGETAGAADR